MSEFSERHSDVGITVLVKTYGARTEEPFVAVRVGAYELMTTSPEQFFEEVAQAKAAWDGRLAQ